VKTIDQLVKGVYVYVFSTLVRTQSLSLYHLSFLSRPLQTRTEYGTANRKALKFLMCRMKATKAEKKPHEFD
jgi:hypothetical protein